MTASAPHNAAMRSATGAARIRTPFATLAIATDGETVTHIRYLPLDVGPLPPTDDVAARAVDEIGRYLDDPSWRFGVPLASVGSPFHRRVWQAIAAIRAGETRTYGALARDLGADPRAIGQACGANPIPLIVPCHRVVGAGGALGGFMGRRDPGVREPDLFASEAPDPPHAFEPAEVKRWLLAHEGCRFAG